MNERKVLPEDLTPGMVLAEPICHPFTRQVIWTSGTQITEQHIALLKKMELRSVRVIDLQEKQARTGPIPRGTGPALTLPAVPREAPPAAPEATAPPVAPAQSQAAAPRPAFRLTPPQASGQSGAGAARPTGPRTGPIRPAQAQGANFRPQAIRNEVLERNVQTIKQIHEQVKQATRIDIQSVDQTVQATITRIVSNRELLASLIDLRVYDEYTYAHSSNVMSLSLVVGAAMGFPPEKLRILGIGALLHDVGKSLIPEAILHKPGKLTEEEFNIMATHPANGIMILSSYGWATPDIKNIVFQHHEKFDGSGYPMKLSGMSIAEFARVVSVVDVYDALISQRPYKKGLPPNVVFQAILNGAGTHFDPKIVQAFVKFIVPYPVNSLVELNTGQIARVVKVSRANLMRPVIELEGSVVDLARDERFNIVTMYNPA